MQNPPPAYSVLDLRYTAVFRWKRRQSPNNTIPDPADNPPSFCWIIESAKMNGRSFIDSSQYATMDGYGTPRYSPTHPYPGDAGAFKEINHPFALKYNGLTVSPDGLAGMLDLDKRRIKSGIIRGDLAYDPTAHFKAKIDLTNYAYLFKQGFNAEDEYGDLHFEADRYDSGGGTLDIAYEAKPVTLAVLARLKAGHVATDLNTGFASSAAIAAGHLKTEDGLHEADLVLQVMEPDQENRPKPVQGIELPYTPSVEVVNKNGVEKGVTITAPTSTATTTSTSGRVPLGNLTARDLTTSAETAITVKLANTQGDGAGIDQNWASIEWKMGEAGERPWSADLNFVRGEDGYTDWLWAKLIGPNGKPLVEHNLKFIVRKLVVKVLDTNTQTTTTKFFTTDPLEAQLHGNSQGVEAIYNDYLNSLVSSYITIPSKGKSDSNGVFKGAFTVKNGDVQNRVLSIEALDFFIEDEDVYLK